MTWASLTELHYGPALTMAKLDGLCRSQVACKVDSLSAWQSSGCSQSATMPPACATWHITPAAVAGHFTHATKYYDGNMLVIESQEYLSADHVLLSVQCKRPLRSTELSADSRLDVVISSLRTKPTWHQPKGAAGFGVGRRPNKALRLLKPRRRNFFDPQQVWAKDKKDDNLRTGPKFIQQAKMGRFSESAAKVYANGTKAAP